MNVPQIRIIIHQNNLKIMPSLFYWLPWLSCCTVLFLCLGNKYLPNVSSGVPKYTSLIFDS